MTVGIGAKLSWPPRYGARAAMTRVLSGTSGAPVRRISVVGPSGSGKTHLARDLADRLGLPLHELDALRWDSNGRELSRVEFVDLVEALAAQDAWIIDGHYRDVRHLIWRRAEMVAWLNYPLPVVALRLLGRFRQKRQALSTGLAGSAHPVTATWGRRLSRLARTIREHREYSRLLRAPEYSALAVTELKSGRATREWLEDLGLPSEQAPGSRATMADEPARSITPGS